MADVYDILSSNILRQEALIAATLAIESVHRAKVDSRMGLMGEVHPHRTSKVTMELEDSFKRKTHGAWLALRRGNFHGCHKHKLEIKQVNLEYEDLWGRVVSL